MISKPTNILSYAKMHPIKSGVLFVLTFFAITGMSFGALYIIAPEKAEALVQGPGCCSGGVDPWFPGPIITDPGFPGFGGGGGGGGGTPTIIPSCTLTVAPNSIDSGESAMLSWTTTNARSAVIDQGIGSVAVPSGTRAVTPTVDTTYTMTVTSVTGHTATCGDSVIVIPDTQPLCTLTISPSVVDEGESAVLSWTTTNATKVSLNPILWGVPSGLLPPSGSVTITPNETTTYVLTAEDDDGDRVTCVEQVVVDPIIVVNPPVCTLSISPETIKLGESATISWETRHADTFEIDNGVGDVFLMTEPIANGSITITPTATGTFTYTGTVENRDGDTSTCAGTVIVTPVDVTPPTCTLDAAKLVLDPGETTTLTWTTTNATSVTIQLLDAIYPVDLNGTWTDVSAGTYTLTAQGEGGTSVTCVETITVNIPGGLECSLDAAKLVLDPGETTTLTWTTTDATSATLDGAAVDLNGNQTDVGPGTYTLVAENAAGDTVTCTETIIVNVPGGLACTLDIDRDAMRSGETAEMTWTTTNAVSFSINNEDKDLNGSETIRPTAVQEHVFTGTATDAAGNTVTCSDSITVEGGSGGSNLECSLTLVRSVIKPGEKTELRWETRQAESVEIDNGIGSVAFIGSQEVAPTGVGRYEYILTARGNGDQVSCRAELVVEGGGGGGGGGGGSTPQITIDLLRAPVEQPFAFVTLSQIPYTGIELGAFGTAIYWLFLTIWSGAVAYLVLFKIFPFVGRRMVMFGEDVMGAVDATKEGTMEAMEDNHVEDIQLDGFSPEPSESESLSIEDIVRGLSRKQEEEEAPVVEEEEIFDTDVITEMSQPPVVEHAGDDMRFLNALMQGDRDTTFGILRRSVKNGARPEVLIEGVIVHLDTAYRARVEGGLCSDDVRRMCAACDTALLEEIISALTSAVDTTYSHAQTGAKLALTRAHAIIDRG